MGCPADASSGTLGTLPLYFRVIYIQLGVFSFKLYYREETMSRVIFWHPILPIDTADYFIAQAAMDHSVPLLTLNTRHFTLVPGLLVVNP